MNDDIIKLQHMDDPFAIDDAIEVEVIVNSPDKIKSVFENLAKFKQL